MSKFKEWMKSYYIENGFISSEKEMQAAWNARGEVDAEIARTQADPWAAIGYEQCAKDCAEAIEQEQT